MVSFNSDVAAGHAFNVIRERRRAATKAALVAHWTDVIRTMFDLIIAEHGGIPYNFGSRTYVA